MDSPGEHVREIMKHQGAVMGDHGVAPGLKPGHIETLMR
jgi:hypothetical protein